MVNLLLVLALAYSLAGLTLRWLPSPEPSVASDAAALMAPTGDRAGPDPGLIASWQLFGAPETNVPIPAQAPETRLNLRLAGILHRDAPLALIAEGNRPEAVYRVGDTIGGARIEQILPDRVLLARGSGLEALSLPREPSPLDTASRGVDSPTGVQPVTQRLRQALSGDPQALQELALAAPYIEDGRFIGLQLRPGHDRQLLDQLGLRAGDVLTALNGVRLTDPVQGLRLMQELSRTDRVDATIRRGDSEIPMTFVLQ